MITESQVERKTVTEWGGWLNVGWLNVGWLNVVWLNAGWLNVGWLNADGQISLSYHKNLTH